MTDLVFSGIFDKLDSFVADVDSKWVVIRSRGFVNIYTVDISNVPQFLTVVKVHEIIVMLRCTIVTRVSVTSV